MKRQSFTLVEMLTVLAIIMVLAGLLYPAITSSRTTARTSACLSNQRQVVMAIQQSMNANKNHFYSPNYDEKKYGVDDSPVRWTARLRNRKYLPDYKVMYCSEITMTPKIDYVDPTDKSPTYHNHQADSYTYGALYHPLKEDGKDVQGFDFRGTKFLKDKDGKDIPPTKLMLGSCSWNTERCGGALLRVDKAEISDRPYGTVVLAHRGAVNMFFLDGRAASLSFNDLKANPVYYPDFNYTTGEHKYASKFDEDHHTIIK